MADPITSITVRSLPHNKQRYNTSGDWQIRGQHLMITVSEVSDWRSMMAVAVHEIAEALMCHASGITDKMVDAFDLAYEGDDPGDDPECPYHAEHTTSVAIERIMLAGMGMNWTQHDAELANLERGH